jgi:hypothetical protein
MHHRSRSGDEVGFADVMAFFFLGDDSANEVRQFFVAGAAAHLRMQVVIPN